MRLTTEEERRLNLRAARRLHKQLDATYKGQWVGLVRGQFIAAGETPEEVTAALMQVEPDPGKRFLFRAGEDYRKKVTILVMGR